ncbi:uncharacterized protein F5891DRAFT_1175483 [Suillus fuscotomentosus]|uniref:Uncharacterized protein n=1 Tax=Suillus fuscotomentosus TaxID=1912939 RepID=A0AAD4HHM8_9AGAM|nr:uncharacterized protein F5891DRAFT_1175483 [Suillus fuscotomentosus]KAG1895829.1 hypothetical protein F5891DRAFT_1175483 [Suillus fuscotomentosus]
MILYQTKHCVIKRTWSLVLVCLDNERNKMTLVARLAYTITDKLIASLAVKAQTQNSSHSSTVIRSLPNVIWTYEQLAPWNNRIPAARFTLNQSEIRVKAWITSTPTRRVEDLNSQVGNYIRQSARFASGLEEIVQSL